MKSKWLRMSKVALLLICIGFFMPISCDMNGTELAKMFYKMDSVGYAILIWVVFISAVLSIVITLLHKDKIEDENLVVDWFLLGGTVLGGLFSIGRVSREYFKLQCGAYIIIVGWILSLIFLIMASCSGKKQNE